MPFKEEKTHEGRSIVVYNDERLEKIIDTVEALKIDIDLEIQTLEKEYDIHKQKSDEAYKKQDDYYETHDLNDDEEYQKFMELEDEYKYWSDRETCLEEYIEDLKELQQNLERI